MRIEAVICHLAETKKSNRAKELRGRHRDHQFSDLTPFRAQNKS
jgi:hypothetical protein